MRLALRKPALPPGPHRPAPFVVGVNRSGTTLLRLMLDAHPQLAIPPETHFLPELAAAAGEPDASPESIAGTLAAHRRWGDLGLSERRYRRRLGRLRKLKPRNAIRVLMYMYAESQGKPRWGEKTPSYLNEMFDLQELLPEARFIHVIRDGRDVALSRRARMVGSQDFSTAELARRWRRRIRAARRKARRLVHYLEVRYEDIVTEPEATLRRICDFIELDFDPAMLRYYERAPERLRELSRDLPPGEEGHARPAAERLEAHALVTQPPSTERIGRWRTEMTGEELAEFEEIAGDLLSELGYETRVPARAKEGAE